MRNLLRFGASTLALLLIMFGGSLVLWIGLPVAWLWIASQIEGATNSVGLAVLVGLVGFVATVAAALPGLMWVSNKRRQIQVARGLEDGGHFALEVVLVTSAAIAAVAFGVWFLVFSGASPIPLGLPS